MRKAYFPALATSPSLFVSKCPIYFSIFPLVFSCCFTEFTIPRSRIPGKLSESNQRHSAASGICHLYCPDPIRHRSNQYPLTIRFSFFVSIQFHSFWHRFSSVFPPVCSQPGSDRLPYDFFFSIINFSWKWSSRMTNPNL